MSEQLSFFSAGVRPAGVGDLQGLLTGPGQLVRRGASARISVPLSPPQQWRLDGLLAGFSALGLGGGLEHSARGLVVRSDFDPCLMPLVDRWTRGAVVVAPADLTLDGGMLRWWCLAAGHSDDLGYVLPLGNAESGWDRVGAALARSGVPGTLVRPRATGRLQHPAYRVVGARRLSRLAELSGPPPPGAVGWPGGR